MNGLEVEINLGANFLVTAEHFDPAGMRGAPIPGDFASVVPSSGKHKYQITGYARLNGEHAPDGELWLESVEPATGETRGSFRMLVNGDIVINGVVFRDGNILAPGEITARSEGATPIPLSTHIHLHPMAPTQGPSTPPPTPGG